MASSSRVARGTAAAADKHIGKIITASSVGTMIEWYQFFVFGSLATTLASKFFQTGTPLGNLIAWLAAFAVGFIFRPFGTVFFGRVGTMIGRDRSYMVTMSIMAACTFLVGIMPTAESIGAAAGIILVVLRILQGLALGGEYSGAATYIAEHAPQNKRGLYTSFLQLSATAGFLLSMLVVLICRMIFGEAAFDAWGWRVPFLLSVLLLGLSIYLRSSLKDSPLFLNLKSIGQTANDPVKESITNPINVRYVLLAIFGATMGQGVIWYTSQFYALYYMQSVLHVPLLTSAVIMVVVLLLSIPLFVLSGWLSDQIGRKWMLLGSMALAALSYYSIYATMGNYGPFVGDPAQNIANPDYSPFMLGLLVCVQMIFVAMAYGPIAAYLVEMFPTRIRYSSMALPYHIGNGVFGGLVPLFGLLLIQSTGNPLAGVFYTIAIAIICLVVGAIFLRESKNVDITTTAW